MLAYITEFISNNYINIIMGLAIACFLFLIVMILLLVSMNHLKNRVDRFVGAKREKHNIEAMLIEYLEKVNAVDEKVNAVDQKYEDTMILVKGLNKRLDFCIQRVGILRYNPFDTVGADLSFAVALLDENNNGVVFNTLHGREASYTYAKPVFGMGSTYTLSDEEKEAIRLAAEEKRITVSV